MIEPLCALLSCSDNQVIKIVLDALQTMLEFAEPDVHALANLIEECEGIIFYNYFSFALWYK